MPGSAAGRADKAVIGETTGHRSAVGTLSGLSEAEALARRARGQRNVAPLSTGRTYAQILHANVLTFINY
jgi:cation-transporting P-type ATPase E